ncbi:MAG: hypothetical protein ABXS91_10435 [Sulfurimonas sp.]
MQKSTLPTDLLNDELRFLIACCQAEPTQDLALNADTPVVKTKVGCDTDLIRSYLSQSDTPQPTRHPREGGDPQSQSETGTPSSSTPIGDPQSQSDKHQNLILLANRHGVLPLVYKTLKRLSEEGLLRDPSDVNRKADNKQSQSNAPSSSTPLGDPQSQSDNTHSSITNAPSGNTLGVHELRITNYESRITNLRSW